MEKKIKSLISSFIGNRVEYIEARPHPNLFLKIWKSLFYGLLKITGLSVLPLVLSSVYKNKTGKLTEKIVRAEREGYTSNVIFNTSSEEQELIKVKLPDLKVQRFSDVYINGDSDFIIDIENNCVINDTCYDLNERYTAYDGVLYRLRKNTAILRNRLAQFDKEINAGIVISGKFSRNFYHEVYENLIKLLVLDECNIPPEVPIIVDDIVSEISSLKRLFEILTINSKRNVIYIGRKDLFRIHDAFIITPVNRLTSHLKNRDTLFLEDFVYDSLYLNKMRKTVLCHISKCTKPDNVFISRHNVSKRQFNEDDVLGRLKDCGFECVCPELMSFDEQVSLFNGAKFIIGGSGAAFSNLLFCEPGCKVLCIVDSVKYGFPIFSTIAYLTGCKMVYYGNEIGKVKPNDIHSDFNVNIDNFVRTLECLKIK